MKKCEIRSGETTSENSANAEDEISNEDTEYSALSSKQSSDVAIVCPVDPGRVQRKRKRRRLGPVLQCTLGILCILFAMGTIIYTPFAFLMNERLKMMPGFPPYEWWKNPPDEVLLRVYVFNITNPWTFLSGEDSKINLQEIGPIIYREKLIHSNVVFNENSTMSYTATRKAVYLPEMNTIDLNQTLYVPNLVALGMANYFQDTTLFTKFGFNLLIQNLKTEAIVNLTIDQYLWNFTDPLLELGGKLAPKMVPVKNMGILSIIYNDFKDNVTVYVGAEHGHEKYFLIDRYDGSEYLPNMGRYCKDKLVNSTEGVAYPQFLTKRSVLSYWRKTMCKVFPLYYKGEASKYGVKGYEFYLPNSSYDRTEPLYDDCYKGNLDLESGLSDVSKCYYNMPMAASFPHFLYGGENIKATVTGLNPEEEKHKSYVIVEPLTGIPFESKARSQSNLVLRQLSGFHENIDRFSNVILPMFWAEYNQVGLPWYIIALMYFTVVLLPYLQRIFTVILMAVGGLLIVLSIRTSLRQNPKIQLLRNKALEFEKEIFIKNKS